MECKFNFVVDSTKRGRIYPALAQWSAEPYTQSWREFDQHWPFTVPLRLQEYCDWHQGTIALQNLQCPEYPSFYPIALGWFDFGIDYFEMMPPAVLAQVRNQNLRVLFYYHEGDNPQHIKNRLDMCAAKNLLPPDCYRFISGNSAARKIPNFVYFVDFELWYWHRNHSSAPLMFNTAPRNKEFSALVRLSKDWRMAAMTDLWCHNVLTNSYWSYCEPADFNAEQCPIAVDSIPGLRHNISEFQSQLPVFSDTLSQQERNNHANLLPQYYTDAYFHIVMETHFDADGSGGAFLTEKTFKPIKHNQPFVIAGPSGSLQVLRDLGYRVFDHVIDNAYDTIVDNTDRWICLRNTLLKIQQQDIHKLCEACKQDCEHNQQLFLSSKHTRLSTLIRDLHEKS